MGSRYGGLKQLDPVGPDDETIMDYSIFDARRAGFGKVVFVIRKEIEEVFKDKIGVATRSVFPWSTYFKRPAISFPVFRCRKVARSRGAQRMRILMAANVIHEPFGVINADDFYGASSYRLLAQHLQSEHLRLRDGGICSAQHALGVWQR